MMPMKSTGTFCLALTLLLGSHGALGNSTATILQLRKSVEFSYKGANLFLDLIRGNASRSATDEVLNVYLYPSNYHLPSIMLAPIVKHFPGYMACLIFSVLFVVFLPIIGLFFCCLRCCGRCGGRLSPMDRKADPYRRVCYTITLAFVVTIQLAAIVLAFINYNLHYESTTNNDSAIGALPQVLQSIYDFEYGMNEIIDAAKNSSSVSLNAQKERFDSVFDAGLTNFQEYFVDNSSASTVLMVKEAFQRIVYRFAANSPDAVAMKKFFELLERVTSELPLIRTTISEILNTECTVDQLTACRELRFTTDNDLKVAFTLDQFQAAQVTSLLEALAASQQRVKDLDKFNASLLRMKADVKAAIQPILDDAWKDLSNSPKTREDLVKTLQHIAESVNTRLDYFNSILGKATFSEVSTGSNEYVLYTGFAFLCLPAFIILLFYLGLAFGVCGDRPHEEAGFCNRGVGSNLLLSGMVFIFLLSSLLMVVCTAIFVSGGLAQTEACRYATRRYGPQGPSVLDEALSLFVEHQQRVPQVHPDLLCELKALASARPFNALLSRCANESLVDAFGDELIGLMVSDNSIDKFLESILSTFNSIDLISPLRKTSVETLQTLNEVANLRDYNFSQALAKVNDKLTYIDDFDAYLQQLEDLDIYKLRDHISILQETVGFLALRLKSPIGQLYTELQALSEHYNRLTDELNRFSTELDRTVPVSIRGQIEDMRPLFLKELRLAVVASWGDISCWRLHSAATTGVNAVCVTFLEPLNGLWFGLGIFLVLCVFTLIFAGKLVNLYRKTEKYSPDYEQPDYISYQAFYMRPANSEGDTVTRRKRRQRKGKSTGGNGVYMPLEPVA